VLNEGNMASNSATKVPTQASVKTYVDNFANGLTWKAPVDDGDSNPTTGAGTAGPIASYGACDAAKKSWTTYNKNDAVIYVCNGTAWVEMSSTVGIPNLAGDVTGPLTSNTIANNAVTSAKIADSTIVSGDILDGTITTADVLDGTITTGDIADGTIATGDIADNAITSAKVAADTLVAEDIASNAIGSAELINNSIVDADVNAAAAIAGTKISPNFGSQTVQTTGNLAINTDKFFVNGTTGNVGVGTASPSSLLETYVTGGNNTLKVTTSGSSSYIPKLSLNRYGDTAWNLSSNGTTGLLIDQDGSVKMTVQYSTGNFGIGTTSPNQQLEITKSFRMPNTTDATTGVIYKGTDRFMHNYVNPTSTGANTFIGSNAGNFTMGPGGGAGYLGSYNTAVGFQTLYSNTTGYSNTATGYNALVFNTTGYGNTANGYQSLQGNISGSGNTAQGYATLRANTTGYENTATGYGALISNTTGNSNTATGLQSLYSNTTGYSNTANGVNALFSNTSGFNNSAGGMNALHYNTTGYSNTANGVNALHYNTTGYYNTANGSQSLFSNTTGYSNTANGVNALH